MKAISHAFVFVIVFLLSSSISWPGTRVPVPLSLLQLIANPEKYDGKIVAAVGFLEIEKNKSTLYLHREDRDFGLVVNSLNIVFSQELTKSDQARFNRKYVYVSGTFDAKDKGPRSDEGGAISPCDVIVLWPSPGADKSLDTK
jgi:hypothetical protein